MAKILHLRKQELLLEDREKEMIRHGLITLNELNVIKVTKKEEVAR